MTKTRETMIADIGRRHPAAADDVDALLAMPHSDAVNEGLLAIRSREEMARIWLRGTWFEGDVKAFEACGDHPEWLAALKGADALRAALRAVPSPDTVEVCKADTDQVELGAMALAKADHLDWGQTPSMMKAEYRSRSSICLKAALSTSHCTAGRREEIAPEGATHKRQPEYLTAWLFDGVSTMPIWLIEKYKSQPLPDHRKGMYAAAIDGEFWRWFDRAYFNETYVALTSEQSGPTAGREELAAIIHKARWPVDRAMAVTPFADEDRNGREYCFRIADAVRDYLTLTPSAPDRQQDQDESSVLPRSDDPLDKLVAGFSKALLAKLKLARANGRDGWDRNDWEKECRNNLFCHLDKGDPRDVAAYCAFMWHHGWITADPYWHLVYNASPPVSDARRFDAATLNRIEDLGLLIAVAKDDRVSSEALGIRLRNSLSLFEQLHAALNNSFDKTGGDK